MEERKIFICECHSLEHQVVFWWDQEDKQLYCEPHLSQSLNFWQRLVLGVKYIFGYRSRYGHWDECLFTTENSRQLKSYLNDKIS
jgi:hypothetical protein